MKGRVMNALTVLFTAMVITMIVWIEKVSRKPYNKEMYE